MVKKSELKLYWVLFVLSMIFTILDLVVASCKMLVPSLIISAITMIIGFIGRNKQKALMYDAYVDDTMVFIKKNFGRANLILSILDVVCCIIAILTCVFVIALLSRCAMALRLAVIINKYRNIAFGAWVLVFSYLFKRGESFKMEEKKENKFIAFIKKAGKLFWSNKKSICGTVFSTISGITAGIATNADLIVTLPELSIFGLNFTAIIVGVLVFAGVEVGVIGKGFETIKAFEERVAVVKAQKTDKKVAKLEEKAKLASEKKAEEDKKKALALLAQKEAEEKAKADKLAEEQRLLALAEKLKAEEEAKKIAEQNVVEITTPEQPL